MVETTDQTRCGLYAELLGDSWDRLDPAVQRLHCWGVTVQAAGVFQIRWGSNRVARALARLARLPPPGEAVPVQLVVSERGDCEEWRRTFGGHLLVTLQGRGSDGLLVERIGLVESRFGLQVVEAGLSYQSVGAALALGGLRIPLPGWLSPKITAWERRGGQGEQVQVSVEVSLPWVGRLISYEGALNAIEIHQ